MLMILSFSISFSFLNVGQAEFTLLKQSVPIESSQLRYFDSSHFHHAEALSALEAGEKTFVISEQHNNTVEWNFSKILFY